MYWTTLYNMSPSGREFNRLRRLTHEVSDDVIKKRKAIIVGQVIIVGLVIIVGQAIIVDQPGYHNMLSEKVGLS